MDEQRMKNYAIDRCAAHNEEGHEHCFQVLDYAHRTHRLHHGRTVTDYPVVPGQEHVTYMQALSFMSGLSEEELQRKGEEFDRRHGIGTGE